jgi:hypothetical protein
MCGEEVSAEMQKVIQELLENDERKGILTSIFIDDRPAEPITFADMMKMKDTILKQKYSRWP